MTPLLGEPDAERPWLLINPEADNRAADAPAKMSEERWDGIPSPLRVDHLPRLNSAWGRKAPQPFELGSLQNDTGRLIVVKSRDGLQTVADYFRRRAWNPTLVVVHELEPFAVADALDEASRRTPVERPGYVPPAPPFDLARIEPLISSELARGNGRPLLDDERPGFIRQWLSFPYPIDADAIRAEFELGDGVELDDRNPPWIVFQYQTGYPDEFHDFPVGGARRFPTAESVRLRALWWEEWRRNPRPRIRLDNPFDQRP